MAVRSYPFDETDYTAADAQMFNCTRTNGVFSSDKHFVVTATTGMQVQVSTGVAWLHLSDFAGAVCANLNAEVLTVQTAHGTLPRIDRIVIRHDFVLKDTYLAIKQGTPASSPAAPGIERDAEAFELGICDIRVNPGVIQLSNANLIDQRLNESICGIMRDAVTGIPTDSLHSAWYTWFNELTNDAETRTADFFDAWVAWLESLQMDAEQRAREFTEWINWFMQQYGEDFVSWFDDFRDNSQGRFDEWFYDFKIANGQVFIDWYAAFKREYGEDFEAWLQDLKDALDGNQAAELYKRIDDHAQAHITHTPQGQHGARFWYGNLEAFLGSGWYTLAKVEYGLSCGFVDTRYLTCAEMESHDLTCQEFEQLIELESVQGLHCGYVDDLGLTCEEMDDKGLTVHEYHYLTEVAQDA